MRRANGAGTVTKLSGNRRRPYAARITTGKTEDGKQITKLIGCYATRDEALEVLLDYNKAPYDVDAKQISMAELYERWRRRALLQGRLSKNSMEGIATGYKHCSELHDMPYTHIKAHMMQNCIDSCGYGYGTQGQIKHLFFQLDNYAFDFDIINKKYSDSIHISSPTPKQKTLFSEAEVRRLWDNIDKPWVDTILILLYSGWRASELLNLLKEDIVIDNPDEDINYMRGGIKTKSGKNRIVPIHSLILPLVRERYKQCKVYLIENNGKQVSYSSYKHYYQTIMNKLDMKHIIHETRHTFRSWLNRTPAKLSCVNKIMGHKSGDVGLDIYTHDVLEDLGNTMELIKSIQIEVNPNNKGQIRNKSVNNY